MRTRGLLIAAALAASGCSRCGEPPADEAAQARDALAQLVATCSETRGEAQLRRASTPYWEALAVGTALRAGDWARTGKDGYARLALVRGGSLELEESAAVLLEAAPVRERGRPAQALVALESGVVRGRLAGGDAPPLLIRPPRGAPAELSARPGAGGLSFRLTAGKEGTEVAVLRGEAQLASDGGVRTLRAGQVTQVGETAADVATLPAFPESLAPGVDARVPPGALALRWRPVAGAQGYRVQVASDLSFLRLVATYDTPEATFTFTPPRPGTYAWRVASRDAAGRLGEYGFARRLFVEPVPKRAKGRPR